MTWAVYRVNAAYNTSVRASTVNGLLGLTATDPIAEERVALLGDYFCYRLPLSVYKGRMVLNAGFGDYRTGGLFRKLTPDQVFRGYFDQFVPATVAPGFFASTLASYTNQEAAFRASPYSPHEMYTGTSDLQKVHCLEPNCDLLCLFSVSGVCCSSNSIDDGNSHRNPVHFVPSLCPDLIN